MVEEPVWRPENYDGLAQLRRAGQIPLAAGENVATLIEFERLMWADAVDFVQPSPAKMWRNYRVGQGVRACCRPQCHSDAAYLL
jgi:L-alanine-DL-glutamate epimerase-like enolase superfamily enzyme